MWQEPALGALTVTTDYGRFLDILDASACLLSAGVLVRFIWLWHGQRRYLLTRAGLGVIAVGLLYAVVAAVARLLDAPLDPMWRDSGWAIRDFGICMYFVGLYRLYAQHGLLSKGRLPPLDLATRLVEEEED